MSQSRPQVVTIQQKAIDIASGEIGVMEATGNNDGPRVAQYLASCSLGEGYPWCAAFIHWCYRHAGYVAQPQREFAAARRWDERRIWKRDGWTPDAGEFRRISINSDLFTLYYASLRRVGHVGMIIDEDEKWVTTIEGNTGGDGEREGGGVYKRKRMKRTLHSICRWLPR